MTTKKELLEKLVSIQDLVICQEIEISEMKEVILDLNFTIDSMSELIHEQQQYGIEDFDRDVNILLDKFNRSKK